MNYRKFKSLTLKKLILIFTAFIATPMAYANVAIEAFEAEDYERAEKLLKQQEATPETKLYLARTAMHLGKLDDAEEIMEEVLESKTNDSNAHYWFARISAQQAANASIFSAPGYASDAKEHFIKAVELDPNNTDAIQGLMGFYSQAPAIVGGSMEKAHELANKLTELDAT